VERRRHPARRTGNRRGSVSGWPDRSGGGGGRAGPRVGADRAKHPHTHTEKKGKSAAAATRGAAGGGGGGAPYLAERRLPREELVRVEHSGCAAESRRRRRMVGRGGVGWGFVRGCVAEWEASLLWGKKEKSGRSEKWYARGGQCRYSNMPPEDPRALALRCARRGATGPISLARTVNPKFTCSRKLVECPCVATPFLVFSRRM
jgi:hypothetical protein